MLVSQKMFCIHACRICQTLTGDSRAKERCLHETPVPGAKQSSTDHGFCFLRTWIQPLAGPIMTAESPNIFFSFWPTENFWLKSRYYCSFVFLTHVTLAVTPFNRQCWRFHLSIRLWEDRLQIQDDNLNLYADVHIYAHTNSDPQKYTPN